MKISIITVCYNAERTIEKTIESVINQTYPDIEYIIIDGTSNDNTLNIIEKYKSKISYFISEKDTGIYNAMNKGIKVATGDVLYFLNADDILLHENVISLVLKNFEREDLLIYGNIITLNKISGDLEFLCFNKPTKKFLFYNFIPHPATFYNAKIFKKYGEFNENYKIVSDYEYSLLLAIKNKIKFKYTNLTIAIFSLEGESSKNISEHRLERQLVQKKYFSLFEYFIYGSRLGIFLNRKIRESQPHNYRSY